jgi:hypothetical protein
MPTEPTQPSEPNDASVPNGSVLVDAVRRLAADPNAVDPASPVDGFAARLLAAGKAARCVGTSCRMHGAAPLHRALADAVAPIVADFQWTDVGCLARCGHGPNLRVDREIFRGLDRCVETDTRTWVS